MESYNKKSILLIGKTGSGKSSFGNFLLGKNKFEVSKNGPCATQTMKESRSFNDQRTTIEVIDTPGLSGQKEEDARRLIEDIKELKNDENFCLVLLILNFEDSEITVPSFILGMIKFLSQIFPVDLEYHFGIVFTNYTHFDEKNLSQRNKLIEKRDIYVPQIMNIISDVTKNQLKLDIEIFFLDNYKNDQNSIKERNRLIYYIKNLHPFERNQNLKENKKYKFRTDVREDFAEIYDLDNPFINSRKVIYYDVYRYNKDTNKEELYSRSLQYKEKELPKQDQNSALEILERFAINYLALEDLNNDQELSLWEKILFLGYFNLSIENAKLQHKNK